MGAALRIREGEPQRAEYKPVLRLEPRHNGNRGLGRPKGAKNILPRKLVEMVYDALVAAGGVEYLARQAEENPRAFLALVARLIPTRITGDEEQPLPIHTITRIIVDPRDPEGTREY